jgi:crotonobetainyl-CoA:carnitine CoA-transferase CaiB-like acyl-CoA transferase
VTLQDGGRSDEKLPLAGVRVIDMADRAEMGGRYLPCAPVLTVADVLSAPHYRERRAISPVEIAPGVTATVPTGFATYNGQRLGIRRPAPSQEIEDLIASGALEE